MTDFDTYKGLLDYFQAMQACDDQDPRWNIGITSLKTWYALSQSTSVDESTLLVLIQAINSYKHQTSGWFGLALFINNWINQRAISTPTIFAWNPRAYDETKHD